MCWHGGSKVEHDGQFKSAGSMDQMGKYGATENNGLIFGIQI